MKRFFCFLSALFFCVFSLISCQAQTASPISLTGTAWTMGFGFAEIVYPDEPLYIAGYHTGLETDGILDAQRVNAVWMSTGTEDGILLLSVDCIGLLDGTIGDIRDALNAFCRENHCLAVEVSATHTHAGVDTMGLWGNVGTDGKNEAFMQNLITACTEAAENAYSARTTGNLRFSEIETDLQYDSREPQVYDNKLRQLRFQPDDTARNGIRIVDYAAHAEALRGDNTYVSRDYVGVLSDTIYEKTGDSVLFWQGAVGGLIMTAVQPEAEENGDFDAVENMRITGERLAALLLSIPEENETELSPSLSLSVVSCDLPLDNTLFLYYKFLGILDAEAVTCHDSETGYAIRSECGCLILGNTLCIALIPGELFPELAYGDTLTEADPPSILQTSTDVGFESLWICGLCGDAVGYIVPPSVYRVDEKLPYIVAAPDATGENHYEETNSVGYQTAFVIQKAFADALAAVSGK